MGKIKFLKKAVFWHFLTSVFVSGLLLICLVLPGLAQYFGDAAWKVAVDPSGNVIVTGYSYNEDINTDFLTIKYDANGNWLWGRRLNGPANGGDVPKALAVDTSGNVIVTGSSHNGSNYDYVTIKYDANGNWVWGRRNNGTGNGNDWPFALAVDASGNVYVTGSSDGIFGNSDYLTIKYDANGNWAWGRRHNGTGNGNDDAYGLAVDPSGNVIVTGASWNGANADFVTLNYDKDGNWLWGQRNNGPANGDDFAQALAVDASGNVYVTGRSWNGSNYDYLTLKYSSWGAWLWGTRYNGPANGRDRPRALAVDPSGNVYVTGQSYNGANYDYLTVKYGASGTWWGGGGAWLWGQRNNGPANGDDGAIALAVFPSGNVVVTGWSWNGADEDYLTIKYDSGGAWLWGQRYDGPD